MSLEVFVGNAVNVPNIEKVGKSDPYCTVEFLGVKKKTQVQKQNLNPVWNEQLVFTLADKPLSSSDKIDVYVKDWERVGRNRLLGKATVSLRDLLGSSHSAQVNVNLTDGNNQQLPSTVSLNLKYIAPAGHGEAKIEANQAGSLQAGVTDSSGEQIDLENQDEVDMGIVAGEANGVPVSSSQKPARLKPRVKRNLSTKTQDFQIRVRVMEARRLVGDNIHPVCHVTVEAQQRQTRIRHSTSSPYWNEIFFLNFVSSQAELFEELITFKIFNSKKKKVPTATLR